ncbi:MAG TPA: ABC transporter permease [Gemmatimonadaceae bacterium]|nr:ABC transporter permease [Gemmatimonadaceae bacterium]
MRRFISSRGVTIGIIVSAAVGVAVATVGATLPLNFLAPPSLYRDGNRVVRFSESGLAPAQFSESEEMMPTISLNVLDELRAHPDVFEQVFAYNAHASISYADRPGTSNIGAGVPYDLLPRLGVKAKLGRLFREEEDAPGQGQVIVLSHREWRTSFGRDAEIVGKVVRLTRRGDHTVIGVVDSTPTFPPIVSVDFYVPMGSQAMEAWHRSGHVSAVGIVREGVSRARVRAITDVAAQRFGETDREARRQRSASEPYVAPMEPVRVIASAFRRSYLSGREISGMLAFTLGLSLTILAIAALNIASLSLARMIRRGGELAVRSALGASRRRLVTGLIGETVAVAAVGGALGLVVATAIFAALAANTPPEFVQVYTANWRVAPAAIVVTLLAALGGVAWPAYRLGRADLHGALQSTRASWGRSTSTAFRNLVSAEVALTTALCVGAAAFIAAVGRYVRLERGFESANAVTISVMTPEADSVRAGSLQTALDIVAQVPGVTAVAAGALPVPQLFTLSGGATAKPGVRPTGMQAVIPVAGDYFGALGIRLLAGRTITSHEARTGARVAVLGASMANALWPNQSALGKLVYFGGDAASEVAFEVVGIANEIAMPFPLPLPQIYLPYAARVPRATSIVARVAGDPAAILKSIQSALADGRSGTVARDASLLTHGVRRGAGSQVFFASVLSALSVVGLMLAAAGLYGVTSFTTRQRTREFGIRTALGATPARLLWFALREVTRPVTRGLVVGLAGGVTLTGLLGSRLVGVRAVDPIALLAVSLFMLLVAGVAALHPALRAARIDPAAPLRSD